MNKLWKFMLLFAAGTFALACGENKDDDNTLPAVYGTFQVTDLNVLPFTQESFPFTEYSVWVRLEDDNMFYVLEQTPLGFRNVNPGVFSASETQVNFDGFLANYSVNGDEIVLSHPNYEVGLTRDASAPEVVDWVGLVTLDSPEVSVRAANSSDMAWDGTYLWYGHYSDRELIQYDFATEQEIRAVVTTNSVLGVGWDGATIWVSSNGYDSIRRINLATGANETSSPEMGPWIYGIACDGTYLWTYSNNERTVYQFDPIGNTIVNTVDVSELTYVSLRGLEYVDGYLYFISSSAVYQVQPDPFQVVETFLISPLDFPRASGIAHNGSDFYGFRYDQTAGVGLIARLALSR